MWAFKFFINENPKIRTDLFNIHNLINIKEKLEFRGTKERVGWSFKKLTNTVRCNELPTLSNLWNQNKDILMFIRAKSDTKQCPKKKYLLFVLAFSYENVLIFFICRFSTRSQANKALGCDRGKSAFPKMKHIFSN